MIHRGSEQVCCPRNVACQRCSQDEPIFKLLSFNRVHHERQADRWLFRREKRGSVWFEFRMTGGISLHLSTPMFQFINSLLQTLDSFAQLPQNLVQFLDFSARRISIGVMSFVPLPLHFFDFATQILGHFVLAR